MKLGAQKRVKIDLGPEWSAVRDYAARCGIPLCEVLRLLSAGGVAVIVAGGDPLGLAKRPAGPRDAAAPADV